MDPDRFARLREIVLAAAAERPEHREAFLARECGTDRELHAAVFQLLEFDPGESDLDHAEGGSEAVGELTPSGVPGYRVLRKLGEGGMGTVYLAEDLKLGRSVALKFLRPEHVGPGTLTRFVHEARAAAAIDHPSVCTVHGFHQAAGRAFIEMAYVDGTTLQQRMSSGTLAMDEALEIALQVAQGLDVAHAKGIVHRDLKPSNVMLSTGGSVKIVDFGIAQSGDRSRITRIGARMGTIGYTSPEQLRGDPVDPRADVWAFGTVLFEMLTGRLPFQGDSDPALGYNIVHERPLRLSRLRDGIHPSLGTLIERCLEKRPADRPDARQIVRILEALRQSPDAVPRIRRRGRNRIRVAAALAAIAVLLSVAWWRGWMGREREVKAFRPHLTRLTVLPDEVRHALLPGSISPDGRSLALPLRHLSGDWAALAVISIDSGGTRRIAGPAGEVYSAGWMPDGNTLLTFEYRGDLPWRERPYSDDSHSQIWLRNFVANTSTRIYEHSGYTTALWPMASPDGERIALYHGDRRSVWIMNASGGELRKIREVPPAERLRSLVWSPDGSRVAYVRVGQGENAGFPTIETCDLAGDTTVILDGDKDLDPGREDGTLCWLPDGRLVFNRFTNFLRTTSALWSIRTDLATGRARGEPVRLLDIEGAAIGQPTASADGRRMAFYAWQANMRPRLLELGAGGDSIGLGRWSSQNWPAYPGAWTRDGRGLYFTVAVSSGNCDIYFEDLATGLEEPLVTTSEQESVAGLTPDDSAMLFWKADRLMRMPSGGGPAVEIFRSPTPVVQWQDVVERVLCPSEPGARCVLKRVEGQETVFCGFDPHDGKVQAEIARVPFRLSPPSGRCDLSPDGRRIAILARQALSVLELADGSLSEIRVGWTGTPTSVRWSGDGTWLCVSGTAGEATSWLRRVDLDGTSRFLWRGEAGGIAPCMCPSPDGSGVALTLVQGVNDVWMAEDF